jgi:hypothetical protein
MFTSKSVGRLTATRENDRSASKSKKDRSVNMCAFTFADGRQCRSLRWSGHQHLCYDHAKKEAEADISKQAREDLVSLFCGKVLSAPDFTAALGRVLSAVAFGHIKPKAALTLALLGHTLNQSIDLAQHECANASNHLESTLPKMLESTTLTTFRIITSKSVDSKTT